MKRWTGLAFLAVVLGPSLDGQVFEVASVKPCKDAVAASGGRKGDGGTSSPARLHLTCQTVMNLIQWAYVNFADDRFDPLGSVSISGGPRWIDSERYEIDA